MLPSTKIKGINFSKKFTKVLAINDVALRENDSPKCYFWRKELTPLNALRGLDMGSRNNVQMWPFSQSVSV